MYYTHTINFVPIILFGRVIMKKFVFLCVVLTTLGTTNPMKRNVVPSKKNPNHVIVLRINRKILRAQLAHTEDTKRKEILSNKIESIENELKQQENPSSSQS